MTGLELLKKYPVAGKIVKDWFLDRMMESMKTDAVPDEFKEFVKAQGISDSNVATFIDANPRSLFDVLDENQIYIQISVDVNKISDENTVFRYSINSSIVESIDYPSRKDAEKDAVQEAMMMLNKKSITNAGQDSTASNTEIPTEE